MNSKFIHEHDQAIKPQNLGPLMMKSSQSNVNVRSTDSYSACSYLIATAVNCVTKGGLTSVSFSLWLQSPKNGAKPLTLGLFT